MDDVIITKFGQNVQNQILYRICPPACLGLTLVLITYIKRRKPNFLSRDNFNDSLQNFQTMMAINASRDKAE